MDAPAISSTLFERRSDGGEAQLAQRTKGAGQADLASQPVEVGRARGWEAGNKHVAVLECQCRRTSY